MSFDIVDDIPAIDRSTLERWSECPLQASLCEQHRQSVDMIAQSGELVHQAFSETLKYVMAAHVDGGLAAEEIVDYVLKELSCGRADLIMDAYDAVRPSVRAWAYFARNLTPSHIMRFDGGKGARSGQIAYDVSGVRLTCELDLLMATQSPEVVHLIDYKTGWKRWNEDTVAKSFQFRFYTLLIFENYPECQSIRVSIWNTRYNQRTYSVEFRRDDMVMIKSMIIQAIGAKNYGGNKAWPARDKCEICPVLNRCAAADEDLKDIAANPEQALTQLVLLEQKSEAIRKSLENLVKTTGREIVVNGSAFGFAKPKRTQKPKAEIYSAATGDDE